MTSTIGVIKAKTLKIFTELTKHKNRDISCVCPSLRFNERIENWELL